MNHSINTTISTTIFALFAFAGNSVLCRLALGDATIDPTSFTIIRITSGAIALSVIVLLAKYFKKRNSTIESKYPRPLKSKQWGGACALFVYAAGFSYAYTALDTGVGALILFGCVQLSMIAYSIYSRDYLSWHKWLGLFVAFCGLSFLVYSQLNWSSTQISTIGFVLMVVAGIAWGAYSLMGRGSVTPLLDTRSSFVLSILLCVPLLIVYGFTPAVLTERGVWLALASGIITSAFGYAVWYVALMGLSRVQAAVVQLLVPVIAAVGGVIWAREIISIELVIAQVLVLSGITLVMINGRNKTKQ